MVIFIAKRLLIFIVLFNLILFVTSCNQKELELAKQQVTALKGKLDSLQNLNNISAENKRLVTDFYNLAYNTKNFSVVDQYVDKDFIEHNPQGKNGTEELKRFLEFLYKLYPESMVEVKRVIAQDNLVVVHALKKMIKDDRGAAIVEIFRVENGKIVEHWDVSQALPTSSTNNNGMF